VCGGVSAGIVFYQAFYARCFGAVEGVAGGLCIAKPHYSYF